MQAQIPDHCLLCYITDRTAFAPDEPTRRLRLLGKIAEAARAGVDYIQLRAKDLCTRELEALAQDAVSLLNKLRTENQELRTALLINSRTDIALAIGADGVHLRSDDISPKEVKIVWTSIAKNSETKPLIGISCHSPAEVVEAQANGATFAVFAPVFEKKDNLNTRPAGLTHLREACKVKIPVLALGGVTLENAKSCLGAGASGIAAIRLFQENNIAEIVQSLRRIR